MMPNNLFLRRLVIVGNGYKYAYDETFHRGVNIIRGQNSSGKSTIIRFIFFALGVCYSDFVPEAMRCKSVVAEVEINGTVLTLKRELEKTDEGRIKKDAPMYIYDGSIEELQADNRPVKWQKFGYKTTSERRSFSNVLFEIMGLPEFKADSNITMHQILRLIYLDQESPLSSLFFFDIFDKEIIRETTAKLLMGLYDEELSAAQLQQIALNKRIDELNQSIKITREFLSDPTKQSPAFINAQIDNLTKEIEELTQQVQDLRFNNQLAAATNQKLEYQRLQPQVARLRTQYAAVDNEIASLKADIEDSNYFINALQKKIDAVNHSIATREYFDKLHLEYCPECLTKIDDSAPEGHCRLCKSPIDNTRGRSQAIRIKLELEFQIRESQSLLVKNKKLLLEKQATKRALQRELTAIQKQYDEAMRNVRSTRDEQIDALLRDKGYKEGEILQYRTLLESAEKYERLVSELSDLKQQSETLARYIAAAEQKIDIEQKKIERTITDNGLYLLKHDEIRQDEFRYATSFKVDFKQNMAYLKDQHIKLSASSSFYLKMAARFALFFASLQNSTMKYPRLLFSDNMEDKGMEIDRAKNFQRVVVRRLQELETLRPSSITNHHSPDYQLIFATSNIADELDIPEYTIGDFYTLENKSLKVE